jgi:hypothetical protein
MHMILGPPWRLAARRWRSSKPSEERVAAQARERQRSLNTILAGSRAKISSTTWLERAGRGTWFFFFDAQGRWLMASMEFDAIATNLIRSFIWYHNDLALAISN